MQLEYARQICLNRYAHEKSLLFNEDVHGWEIAEHLIHDNKEHGSYTIVNNCANIELLAVQLQIQQAYQQGKDSRRNNLWKEKGMFMWILPLFPISFYSPSSPTHS